MEIILYHWYCHSIIPSHNGNTNGCPMLSNGNLIQIFSVSNIYPDLESANYVFLFKVVPNE